MTIGSGCWRNHDAATGGARRVSAKWLTEHLHRCARPSTVKQLQPKGGPAQTRDEIAHIFCISARLR